MSPLLASRTLTMEVSKVAKPNPNNSRIPTPVPIRAVNLRAVN
jgi:hypothetical protein